MIADYYGLEHNKFQNIHHIDGDSTNDDINNLTLVDNTEHLSNHMSGENNAIFKMNKDYFRLLQSRKAIIGNGRKYHWDEERINDALQKWDNEHKNELEKYKSEQAKTEYNIDNVYVTNIKYAGVEDVYDLSVEDNHNFYIITNTEDDKYLNCSGILVHNCGEQPLPKHGACNLSSINISEYIDEPFTEHATLCVDRLCADMKCIVRAMDDIIDENSGNHALEEQRQMALRFRNIGIGVMGMHDALIKLNIEYGSKKAIEFVSYIMRTLFREAVYASAELAEVRGNFPGYSEKVWNADIFKNAFSTNELEQLKNNGKLRNCSLISVAPTGSIGTMLNISTGVEPFFATSYTRHTVSLNGDERDYIVEVPVIEEAKKHHVDGNILKTSNEIEWHDRIDMQSAMQQYTDTAISSTINLPAGTTPSEIRDLYIYAWEKGLKGVTVYVAGSRDPILSTDGKKKEECNCMCHHTLKHNAPRRPKSLPADIKRFKNGGEKWIAVVGLYEDQPYEIFTGLSEKLELPEYVDRCELIKSKTTKEVFDEESGETETKPVSKYDIVYINKSGNKCVIEDVGNIFRSDFFNVSKMTSGMLRHGMPVEYVVSTIKSLDFVNNSVNSWKAGVIRTLKAYIEDGAETGEVCPNCGGKVVREGGCKHCEKCGWSACG